MLTFHLPQCQELLLELKMKKKKRVLVTHVACHHKIYHDIAAMELQKQVCFCINDDTVHVHVASHSLLSAIYWTTSVLPSLAAWWSGVQPLLSGMVGFAPC